MSILLFGATGMLGRYVLKFLEKDYKIISITRDEYDIEKDDWNKLEIIIKNNIKDNDIIINCAGIILQKYDNYHVKKFIKVNTLFPHKLNELSNKHNLKFIHITTDCVYNGISGNYNEDNIHDSDNIYGISKSLGEPENATIIRTSIIGEEIYHKKSLLEWVLSNKNKEINGFKNHYWNGVTCLTLAKIIHEIIYKKLFWNGVRHIYTPDIISKYDLCKLINNIYDLNITILPLYHDNPKNLILSTKYNLLFKVDNLELQIREQKEFKIKY
jgi:dTDP-4-dehydrorhamnose reductase